MSVLEEPSVPDPAPPPIRDLTPLVDVRTDAFEDFFRRDGVLDLLDGAVYTSEVPWTKPSPEAFRATIREVIAAHPQGWVIDGGYDRKLGDLVTGAADTIVWLDLPLTVVLFRLLRRTVTRVVRREELWNGNRESWRDQFASRESLFLWAFHAHRRHRRAWSHRFAGDPRLVRLRTRADVERWLHSTLT